MEIDFKNRKIHNVRNSYFKKERIKPMNIFRNCLFIFILFIGLSPKSHAHWLELMTDAAGQKAPIYVASVESLLDRAVALSLQDATFSAAGEILSQKNFVKDIFLQDAPADIYQEQFQIAKNIYSQIDSLQAADAPLGPDLIENLQDSIEQLTLMNSDLRHIWVSTLSSRVLPMEKYSLLLSQMERYYGFDTPNDVERLLQQGGLQESPIIQFHKKLYEDFTLRLEKFIEESHRIPQELTFSTPEEITLAKEYNLLKHLNRVNNFGPIKPYIQRIEKAIESIK